MIKFGTAAHTGLDARKMGAALAGPGMDTRAWVSLGTVAVVNDEGVMDYADQHAVALDPDGISVDVELDPSGDLVTCQYLGIQGGRDVQVMAPIRPGDSVVVGLPEGEMHFPVILAILNSTSFRLPMDAQRRTIFDNARLLVFAETVPVDIRTRGGGRVLVEQSGVVTVGATGIKLGANAAEALVKGTSYRAAQGNLDTALGVMLTALSAYVTAIQGVADPTGVATGDVLPAIAVMQSAISSFEGQSYLSTLSKTE